MAQTSAADRLFTALLVTALPASVLAHFLHWPDTLTFFLCCAAVIPLARLIGEATEAIAHGVGSGIGSLLNATFGNAAELILAFAALRAGKVEVVKASLTGSILGNLLLIMGLSMLLGGLKRERQTFNASGADAGISMMFLALTALALPDLYHAAQGPAAVPHMVPLSAAISLIMLFLYVLSLVFTMKTHAHLYTEAAEVVEDTPWSVRKASVILFGATAATAVVAEFLVHAIEGASASLGLTQTFVGIIVVAVVGNAAEHATAVVMAVKNKMNLAFNIAVESSKQIALFVAPVLVLASHFVGPKPIDLEFSHLEVAGLAIGTSALHLIASDGESNWLEGAMLLAVYAILGVAFFHTGP